MSEPRFVVRSVTGFTIRPGCAGTAGNARPATTYYVLDRRNAWRVAACFHGRSRYPDGPRGKIPANELRATAEARAAELNELAERPAPA